ncbi:hypothetical protein H4Q26_009327 [Puccinia striiformis f. sp. tritici PST-130]|nr:hypothetical protein H4Q26_009327 [Puccinia striiformis f. sp. tritici PST-130]
MPLMRIVLTVRLDISSLVVAVFFFFFSNLVNKPTIICHRSTTVYPSRILATRELSHYIIVIINQVPGFLLSIEAHVKNWVGRSESLGVGLLPSTTRIRSPCSHPRTASSRVAHDPIQPAALPSQQSSVTNPQDEQNEKPLAMTSNSSLPSNPTQSQDDTCHNPRQPPNQPAGLTHPEPSIHESSSLPPIPSLPTNSYSNHHQRLMQAHRLNSKPSAIGPDHLSPATSSSWSIEGRLGRQRLPVLQHLTHLPSIKSNTVPVFSSPLAQSSKIDSDQHEDVDEQNGSDKHISPSSQPVPQPSRQGITLQPTATNSNEENRNSPVGQPSLTVSNPSNQRNDYESSISSFDPRIEGSPNFSSRASSSTWSRNSEDGDPDQSSRVPRASQPSPSQSIGRKTSLNKSGAGPTMNRKDVVRMGSPLRHVTHLGPGLSSPVDNTESSQLSTGIVRRPPCAAVSTSTTHVFLRTIRISLQRIIKPPSQSHYQSVLFGSPTPRRKSTLNPMASLNQYQFFSSSSPSNSILSVSASSPSTSSISNENPPNITAASVPTAPAFTMISDSTPRRSSDPTQVPPAISSQSKAHSRPIHHQSSPSLLDRTTTPQQARGTPAQRQSGASVQHSRKMSLASPPGSNSTAHRRNSLIFTPGAHSSSSTGPNHHYNKSTLSAALANNSSSAPPAPINTRIFKFTIQSYDFNPSAQNPSRSWEYRPQPTIVQVTPIPCIAARPSGRFRIDARSNVTFPVVSSLTSPDIYGFAYGPGVAPTDQHSAVSRSPVESLSGGFSLLRQARITASTPSYDPLLADHDRSAHRSGGSVQGMSLGVGSFGPSRNSEPSPASLASPIAISSISGSGEGGSPIQYSARSGSNRLVGKEVQRNRSTSLFSLISSEDNSPYPTGQHSAIPTPAMITGAIDSPSGQQVVRPVASASGGYHTNPSSLSPHRSSTFCPWSIEAFIKLSLFPSGSSQNHRTSIVPGSGPSTEDFAKIIIQSRSAKIQKWKQQQQTHNKRLFGQPDLVSDSQRGESVGGVSQQREGSSRLDAPFSTFGLFTRHRRRESVQKPTDPSKGLTSNTITGRTLSRNNLNHHEMSERFLQPTDGFVPERPRIHPSLLPRHQRQLPVREKTAEIGSTKRRTETTQACYQPTKTIRGISISMDRPNLHQINKSCWDPTEQKLSDLGLNEHGLFPPIDPMRKSASNLTVPSLHPSTNSSGPTILREIEWVDWLDDYRRMKEAKLRAEGQDHAESLAGSDIKPDSDPVQEELPPFKILTILLRLILRCLSYLKMIPNPCPIAPMFP